MRFCYDVGYIYKVGESEKISAIVAMMLPHDKSGAIGGLGESRFEADDVIRMMREGDVFISRIYGASDMIFAIEADNEGNNWLRLDPDHSMIEELRKIGEKPKQTGPNPYRR